LRVTPAGAANLFEPWPDYVFPRRFRRRANLQ
jgi:hypothetical protein